VVRAPNKAACETKCAVTRPATQHQKPTRRGYVTGIFQAEFGAFQGIEDIFSRISMLCKKFLAMVEKPRIPTFS
jgi:hypothetical protein